MKGASAEAISSAWGTGPPPARPETAADSGNILGLSQYTPPERFERQLAGEDRMIRKFSSCRATLTTEPLAKGHHEQKRHQASQQWQHGFERHFPAIA
jgi:hypothetical protein